MAVSRINQSIDVIIGKGGVASLARSEYNRRTADIIEWKIDKLGDMITPAIAELRTVVDETRKQSLLQAGEQMASMFEEGFHEFVNSSFRFCVPPGSDQATDQALFSGKPIEHRPTEPMVTGLRPMPESKTFSRGEAHRRCQFLEVLVYSSDGLELAQEFPDLPAVVQVLTSIETWIGRGAKQSQSLWIEHQFEQQEDNSARATALGVILVAARARVPFISYLCRKPEIFETPEGQTQDGAGILSLTYGLIVQLLQFKVQEDGFRVDPAILEELSETMQGWKRAVQLLRLLLEKTPVLRYCITHGLDELEFGEDEAKCKEIVSLLRAISDRQNAPFSTLFTTSGPSMVLGMAIKLEEQVLSKGSLLAVSKREQKFQLADIGDEGI